MTTPVTIKTNKHGATAQQVEPDTLKPIGTPTFIPPNSEGSAVCHSHAALLIKEVQPEAAEEIPDIDDVGEPASPATMDTASATVADHGYQRTANRPVDVEQAEV